MNKTIDDQKVEITALKAEIKSLKSLVDGNAELSNYQKMSAEKDTEIAELQRKVYNQENMISDIQRTVNELTLIQQTTSQQQSGLNTLTNTSANKNLPKVNDHVVSMWGSSKWQYFTGKI